MNRRDATLPEQDFQFLDRLGKEWEVINEGSTWVLIHGHTLPPGYTQSEVTLAFRIEGGYPMAALDMMYVYPAVQRADGKPINATEVQQPLDQKQFQRWSRHRTNPWVFGEDSLETHYYFVEEAFLSEISK